MNQQHLIAKSILIQLFRLKEDVFICGWKIMKSSLVTLSTRKASEKKTYPEVDSWDWKSFFFSSERWSQWNDHVVNRDPGLKIISQLLASKTEMHPKVFFYCFFFPWTGHHLSFPGFYMVNQLNLHMKYCRGSIAFMSFRQCLRFEPSMHGLYVTCSQIPSVTMLLWLLARHCATYPCLFWS